MQGRSPSPAPAHSSLTRPWLEAARLSSAEEDTSSSSRPRRRHRFRIPQPIAVSTSRAMKPAQYLSWIFIIRHINNACTLVLNTDWWKFQSYLLILLSLFA